MPGLRCGTRPAQGPVWQLPLTVSCLDHGCRLQDAREIAPGGDALQPVPAGEPLAALDRYTYEALITGRVTLPGRSVHAGVWFRLLRSLLDEVSLALTTRSTHGRATLERAWQEAMAEISAAVTLARTDRDAVRQLLALLTIGCRTLGRFEEERAYLFGIGIPAGFLPGARELGRGDLT